MEKFDFVIFGNCATVQILKFKRMPQIGRTETAVNANADEIFFGGCSFNVFCGLSKLGVRSYPVLTYADIRFQDKIYEICRTYGLPTEAIEGPPSRSYSTCIMLQDEERNHITMMYHFGEDSGQKAVEEYPHTIKPEYFEKAKMALMVMGNPATGYEIIRQVRRTGIPLAFSYRNDPHLLPKELLDEILPETEVLFTNEIEAEYLEQLYGMKKITEWFQTGKAKVIVTTLGKDGCIVYEKEGDGAYKSVRVPITKSNAESIDAVGAGDGFVAGFLYGYIRSKPVDICAQYGNTVSSFVIEKDGSTTNLPTVAQMLERNGKRPDAKEEKG